VRDFAYLSGGRLYVQLEGDEAKVIDSPFAAAVASREASIARRNEWKTQGRGARFQRGLEGLSEETLRPRHYAAPVRFSGLCRGRHAAELVYTMSTGRVSGLFAFSGGEEERIFHGADAHLSEPSGEPGGERFACVVRDKEGHTHVGLLVPGESNVVQVTVGDALDDAPRWVPGSERIVFESRPFGYDRAGTRVNVGPATIQELDLAKGEVTPLVAIEGVSCASPTVAADGTLYYLRRPVPVQTVHLGRLAVDALLFPFRLMMAVVQWFNFFSLRYTGKPLLRARDTRAKHADIERAAMIGNLAGAAETTREEDEDDGTTDLSSELVARSASGQERVVARGVACFDLYEDGSVVWSNGRSIVHRTASGAESKLGARRDVERVLALARPA
jgi:hypothetical protein